MSLIKDIEDILLAINMNTKIHIQTVTTVSYKTKAKRLVTKYGIEYLKRVKVFDERDGKNHFKWLCDRTEIYGAKIQVYQKLGQIYQREMEKKQQRRGDG